MTNTLEVKLESEIRYQRERAMRSDAVSRTPSHVVERYRQHRLRRFFSKEFVFWALGKLDDKVVLDFGCGEGHMTTEMALLGARVTGIDVSPDLIEMAQRRAELDEVEERVRFAVQDVLVTAPGIEAFDFVVCTDVLHHTDVEAVIPILHRCLKPGGKLIAREPVSLSKHFQKVRDCLPIDKEASPGDRQLNTKDLEEICRLFSDSEITYFNLWGRFSRFLGNANRIDRGHALTKAAMLTLLGTDWLVASALPYFRRFYGEVVIVASKAA